MIKLAISLLASCILSLSVLSQSKDNTSITIEEPNFESIKNYLKNDLLTKNAKKVRKKIKKKIIAQESEMKGEHNFPTEDDFMSFFVELWLVKNAQILKWDFKKPDYGIGTSFKKFLERMGFYHYKVNVLILDSYNVSHLGIKTANNEYTFLLSLPFMRSMDLTKREISLILFEDLVRANYGYLKKKILHSEMKKMLGENYYKKEFNIKPIKKSLALFTHFVLKEGFSFQQQFEVTKKTDRYLKNYKEYRKSYLLTLKKIDQLAKTNKLFKDYNRLYPSAEMQLKWLSPEESSNKI